MRTVLKCDLNMDAGLEISNYSFDPLYMSFLLKGLRSEYFRYFCTISLFLYRLKKNASKLLNTDSLAVQSHSHHMEGKCLSIIESNPF